MMMMMMVIMIDDGSQLLLLFISILNPTLCQHFYIQCISVELKTIKS